MNEEKKKIWEYLTKHTVGRKKAMHMSILANNLNYEPKGTNNDNLRKLLTEMVMKDNLPIGTCNDGVFLFTNEKERKEASDFVKRRTKSSVISTLNFYSPK